MAESNSPPQETESQQAPEEAAPESSQGPGPSPESEEAPSPEAESTEEATEGDGEGEPEAAAPAPAPPEKHKKRTGYERKIERLERQLEQAISVISQQGRAPAPPAPDVRPKTEQEKAAEQFHALVNERVRAEMSQRDAQLQQQRLQADLQKQLTEARTRHADFDEAMADVSHIPVPPHLSDVILQSEAKAEIMYALAKSPAELARISALPPLSAAREIGRLEAKVASGAAPQTPKPAARPPTPPSKVGGSASSTRSLEDLPLSEYKRRMRSGGR